MATSLTAEGRDVTAFEVVVCYARWVVQQEWCPRQLSQLRGQVLVRDCPREQLCHGDVPSAMCWECFQAHTPNSSSVNTRTLNSQSSKTWSIAQPSVSTLSGWQRRRRTPPFGDLVYSAIRYAAALEQGQQPGAAAPRAAQPLGCHSTWIRILISRQPFANRLRPHRLKPQALQMWIFGLQPLLQWHWGPS